MVSSTLVRLSDAVLLYSAACTGALTGAVRDNELKGTGKGVNVHCTMKE